MLSQTNVRLHGTRRNKFSVLNGWTAFFTVWLTCRHNVAYIVCLFAELIMFFLRLTCLAITELLCRQCGASTPQDMGLCHHYTWVTAAGWPKLHSPWLGWEASSVNSSSAHCCSIASCEYIEPLKR